MLYFWHETWSVTVNDWSRLNKSQKGKSNRWTKKKIEKIEKKTSPSQFTLKLNECIDEMAWNQSHDLMKVRSLKLIIATGFKSCYHHHHHPPSMLSIWVACDPCCRTPKKKKNPNKKLPMTPAVVCRLHKIWKSPMKLAKF